MLGYLALKLFFHTLVCAKGRGDDTCARYVVPFIECQHIPPVLALWHSDSGVEWNLLKGPVGLGKLYQDLLRYLL